MLDALVESRYHNGALEAEKSLLMAMFVLLLASPSSSTNFCWLVQLCTMFNLLSTHFLVGLLCYFSGLFLPIWTSVLSEACIDPALRTTPIELFNAVTQRYGSCEPMPGTHYPTQSRLKFWCITAYIDSFVHFIYCVYPLILAKPVHIYIYLQLQVMYLLW